MVAKKDLKIERIRGGKKAGGQHRNSASSCVRITHIPTGITVTIDQRNQHKNLHVALKEIDRRLDQLKLDKIADIKKSNRDYKIKNEQVIRTYNYPRQTVKDHRTKKSAPIKQIMEDGNLDLLR